MADAPTLAWACLLLGLGASTHARKPAPDVPVTCLFSEDCVLPCSFPPAGNVVINWYKQEAVVYSFLQGEQKQQQNYAGRMTLFPDLIAQGNASLLLQHYSLQDRGQYRCHVNTTKGEHEVIIILRVEASVHDVSLEMVQQSSHEEMRCSTQGVYPAPHVAWSTEPPSTATLRPVTRKRADHQGLYSVESRLRRLEDHYDLTYICTLNYSYGSQAWRSSLQERELNSAKGQALIIPCNIPQNLQNFSLTWTSTRADRSAFILSYDSHTRLNSSGWDGHAHIDPLKVLSGDGSLRVQDPEGSEHTGSYSCTVSAHLSQHVVHTDVNGHARKGERQLLDDSSTWWIVAVVFAVLGLAITGILAFLKLKRDRSKTNTSSGQPTEMQPINSSRTEA